MAELSALVVTRKYNREGYGINSLTSLVKFSVRNRWENRSIGYYDLRIM